MATYVNNCEKSVELPSGQYRVELISEVKSLWDSDVSLHSIARQLKVRQPTVKQIMVDLFGSQAVEDRKRRLYQLSKTGERNPMKGKRYDSHHNYKGRASDNKGYFTVLKPHWFKSKSKRVFEHHVILCAFHKLTSVPKGYCVHHIDHDKSNNSIANLVLMTVAEHARLHADVRRCNDYGETQYTQASGRTQALRQREQDIVYSLRQRKAA